MEMKTICAMLLALGLLAACGGPGAADDGQMLGADVNPDDSGDDAREDGGVMDADKQADKPAGETLRALFGKGKAVKCTFTMAQEGLQLDVTTWATAEKSRSEMKGSIAGQAQENIVIATKDGVYFAGKQLAADPLFEDCDWIFYADASEAGMEKPPELNEAYTLEQAVADARSIYTDYECSMVAADAGLFEPKGKVCDFQKRMEELTAGMGGDLDPSAYGVQ